MEPHWAPDPSRRYQFRWWDGANWTEHVLDHARPGLDPLPVQPQVTNWSIVQRSAAESRDDGAQQGRRLSTRWHAVLAVVTGGLWLLALWATKLWRRGSRRAAGVVGAAAGGLLVAAIAANGQGSVYASPDRTESASARPRSSVVPSRSQGVSSSASARTTASSTTSSAPTTQPRTATPSPKMSSTKAPSLLKPPTTQPTSAKPTTARPTSAKPKPTRPAPAPTIKGVNPGAFCSQHGAFGLTKTGKLMRCKSSATDTRYRWRAV